MLKTWVVILSLVLAALFINSADRPIDNIRESRIAETSREMVVGGDWMVPHFNGDLRLQKPPLTYWTTAISYKLFGVNELSARIPSILFAIMLLTLVFYWVKQEAGLEPAVYVALVLATSSIALRQFRSAEADTALIFFITATCYAGFNFLHREIAEQRKWAVWFMLAMGLGFITKGPAAIAIPLVTLLIYAYLNKRLALTKKLVNPVGLGLFIFAAAGWYIWIFLTMPDATHYFLTKQIDETFISGTHRQPISWYARHIIENFLPWGVLIIPAGIWFYRNRPFVNLVSFSMIWLAVVFVLLTGTVNKQLQYMLLFAPPLTILLGYYLQKATGKFYQLNKTAFWMLCLAMVVLVFYAVRQQGVHTVFMSSWALILLLPLMLKKWFKTQHPAMPILIAAILAAFGYLFSERYLTRNMEKNDIQQLTLQTLTYQPAFQPEPGNGGFSFYANRPIRIISLENLAKFMETHDRVWFYSKEKPALQQYKVQKVKTIGSWTLWEISK